MNMYLRLAWRNIWRNKRRSIISIASVLLAVLIALFMRSMQKGTYARAIDNVVSFYTGYIQIHNPGYWDKKSLNKTFAVQESLIENVSSTEYVTHVTPRLEGYGLISGGERTDVGLVIGINPEVENDMTGLEGKLIEGEYLQQGDMGIMLAKGLSDHLDLGIGDTVVILGQGYHDIMAAGKYEIQGLIEFPIKQLNNTMSYLTLEEAQYLFGAYNRLTSLSIMIEGEDKLDEVMNNLGKKYSEDYEIMSWKEMSPELEQGIEADNASGLIMLFILYMVVGFGILGTILMMTMERTREFGVLIAVGMKRGYLRLITLIESIFLSFVGVVLGTILSVPILAYFRSNPIYFTGELAKSMTEFGYEPILAFTLAPGIFLWQAVVVFIIAFIAALYPLWKITRLDAVDAMRSV
ncbi:MAG: FtsX-like permease family protein [candidate division Zixibacteria bacterium]|nr:FtsX-like permease family protein [candidate division Zixibacteria bacterium]